MGTASGKLVKTCMAPDEAEDDCQLMPSLRSRFAILASPWLSRLVCIKSGDLTMQAWNHALVSDIYQFERVVARLRELLAFQFWPSLHIELSTCIPSPISPSAQAQTGKQLVVLSVSDVVVER